MYKSYFRVKSAYSKLVMFLLSARVDYYSGEVG
jgi:hypothetical protein